MISTLSVLSHSHAHQHGINDIINVLISCIFNFVIQNIFLYKQGKMLHYTLADVTIFII